MYLYINKQSRHKIVAGEIYFPTPAAGSPPPKELPNTLEPPGPPETPQHQPVRRSSGKGTSATSAARVSASGAAYLPWTSTFSVPSKLDRYLVRK